MMTADTKAVLLADAMMFLVALLLGVWKYNQIATSEDHTLDVLYDSGGSPWAGRNCHTRPPARGAPAAAQLGPYCRGCSASQFSSMGRVKRMCRLTRWHGRRPARTAS